MLFLISCTRWVYEVGAVSDAPSPGSIHWSDLALLNVMAANHTLESNQFVRRPLAEVFEFFSIAQNLELLTPPWLKFRILTPPAGMKPGTQIKYRISWHGLPMRWTTEIETWQPPHRFSDVQLSGPYKVWHHTHLFEAERDGTRISDFIQYELPLGPLGNLAHALWVRRDVERIFEYRRQRIAERFGG